MASIALFVDDPLQRGGSRPLEEMFSDLELRVITLAQRRAEYRERATPFGWSWFFNYVDGLVGNGPPQRLASDQLESLRCLVSELRFRTGGPHIETVRTFLETGYSQSAYDILNKNVPALAA